MLHGASCCQWLAFVGWIVLFVTACVLTPFTSIDNVATVNSVLQCAMSFRCRPDWFVAAAVACGANNTACENWTQQSPACQHMNIKNHSVTWFTVPQHEVSFSFWYGDFKATAYNKIQEGNRNVSGRVTLLWGPATSIPDTTGFVPMDCVEAGQLTSAYRWMIVSVKSAAISSLAISDQYFQRFQIVFGLAGLVVCFFTVVDMVIHTSAEKRLLPPGTWYVIVVRRLVLCITVVFIFAAIMAPDSSPASAMLVVKVTFGIVASSWMQHLRRGAAELTFTTAAACAIGTVTGLAPAALRAFLTNLNEWFTLLLRYETWLPPVVFLGFLRWHSDTAYYRIMAQRCYTPPAWLSDGTTSDKSVRLGPTVKGSAHGAGLCTKLPQLFLTGSFALAFTAFLVLSVAFPAIDALNMDSDETDAPRAMWTPLVTAPPPPANQDANASRLNSSNISSKVVRMESLWSEVSWQPLVTVVAPPPLTTARTHNTSLSRMEATRSMDDAP